MGFVIFYHQWAESRISSRLADTHGSDLTMWHRHRSIQYRHRHYHPFFFSFHVNNNSYNSELEGIVIGFDKLEILEDNAEIFFERPHLHFKIRFRALLYRPIIGSYVLATVNNISDNDHIGLLVHGLFNVVLMPSKGALPQEYSFDKEQEAWTNSATQETISMGTKLRLKVTRLEQSSGIISMHASMLDDMTGIIR